MTYSKRSTSAVLFTVVGAGVFFLTLLEIAIGREGFLTLISGQSALLWAFFILLLSTTNIIAALSAFLQSTHERDWLLISVGAIALPYTFFAADNIFFFYEPWVIPNDAVEVASLLYSVACLSLGVRWAVFTERFPVTAPLRTQLNRHRVAAILIAISMIATILAGPLPHVIYTVPPAAVAMVALWRQSRLALLFAVISLLPWLMIIYLVLPFILFVSPLEAAWAWLYWGGPQVLILSAIGLVASPRGRRECRNRR